MATDESIINGGRAIDELLQTLAVKMEKNIMRAALRAGAKVLLDEARSKVPRVTEDLYKSLRIATRARRGQVTASVKAGNRIAFYAHMVEFGTQAHEIKPKRGKWLDINGNLRSIVHHPGARPHPFMRPTADSKFSEAVAAVDATVRKRLTREGLNTPPSLPPDDTDPESP